MAADIQPQATFGWSDDSIELTIEVDRGGTARIARLGAGGPDVPTPDLPVPDVPVADRDRGWTARLGCRWLMW